MCTRYILTLCALLCTALAAPQQRYNYPTPSSTPFNAGSSSNGGAQNTAQRPQNNNIASVNTPSSVGIPLPLPTTTNQYQTPQAQSQSVNAAPATPNNQFQAQSQNTAPSFGGVNTLSGVSNQFQQVSPSFGGNQNDISSSPVSNNDYQTPQSQGSLGLGNNLGNSNQFSQPSGSFGQTNTGFNNGVASVGQVNDIQNNDLSSGNQQSFGNNLGSSSGSSVLSGASTVNCPEGQVSHVDGSCVVPEVTRNIYVYAAPEKTASDLPAPELPTPKVNYNIVFVRTPEAPEGSEPIVVPPPQQKTLVYVLSERGQVEGQQLIEVPSKPTKPEVYYVTYDEGENPQLPGGIDLQSALASAASQQGQTIGGLSNNVQGNVQGQGSLGAQASFGPAPTNQGSLGSAPASQGSFGPAPTNQGSFGSAPASQGSFGSAPASQGSFGSAPASQGSFGSAPVNQGSFGSAPSSQGSFGAAPVSQSPSIQSNANSFGTPAVGGSGVQSTPSFGNVGNQGPAQTSLGSQQGGRPNNEYATPNQQSSTTSFNTASQQQSSSSSSSSFNSQQTSSNYNGNNQAPSSFNGFAAQAPATAPSQGTSNFAPSQGASNFAPSQGVSGFAPSQGASNFAPSQGASNNSPVDGVSLFASTNGANGFGSGQAVASQNTQASPQRPSRLYNSP